MKRISLLLIYFLFWSVFYVTTPATASIEINRSWNGNIILEAHDSVLLEVFKELFDRYAIEVSGLENREDDKITFSFEAETLETLLRGFLRYLGVKNFAIEFAETTLTRIVVVPDSLDDFTTSVSMELESSNQAESIDVAQIQSIVKYSQAESLDLVAGDIILEYDGIRITSAEHLVEEVGKKSESNQVEMIVIREKNPMRLILAGGIIGVRITTKKILKEEINSIY
jgi:hypothetical protein